MSETIVFLDFDGVLCDSIKEAYLLSRYAYYGADVHDAIDSLFERFKKHRYLVTNSWQYFLLIEILNNFSEDEVVYSKFKKSIIKKNIQEYQDLNLKFIFKRNELINNDLDFWNTLETPTSFLLKLKNEIQKNNNYAILSTKTKNAIKAKFNYWNINFNENRILGKEDIKDFSKGQFIRNYLSFNGFKDAILVDDSIDNINSCKNLNIKALLTNWGYVSPFAKGISEDEVIKILTKGGLK